MSGLSDDQKRRMEENRQRALQKRLNTQGSSHGSVSSNLGSSTFSNSYASSTPKISSYPSNNTQGFSNSSSSIAPNSSYSAEKSLGFSSSFSHNPISDTSGSYQPTTSPQRTLPNNQNFGASPSGPVSRLFSPIKAPGTDSGTIYTSKDFSSTGTGNPSVEAAKRMEENRRRALEKRAASQTATTTLIPPVNKNQGVENQLPGNKNPQPNFYKNSQSKPSSSKGFNANNSVNITIGEPGPVNKTSGVPGPVIKVGIVPGRLPISSSGLTDSLGTSSDNSKTQGNVFGEKVNGTFRLESIDRFVVDAKFHRQMLEVLKTMPSKVYDAMTQKWSFSLEDHDRLVSALAPLRPAVCISPLPSFVRKVIKTVSRQIPASCVDLFGMEPKLLEALMPFQHEGVCFGVSRGGRVLFADDMGLGKTIQALAVASHYRDEWPLLVVAPSSVRFVWASAVERWVSSVDRSEITVVETSKGYFQDSTVVIMSYDILGRRAKEVLKHGFQVVILDESHMIKSFKTARYKAAAPIVKQARRVMLLSGTPALSRPSELYTQIGAIDPKLFPSFQDYGIRYCAGKSTNWGWDFNGASNMRELQILLEAKFMIRRLKSQVLDQLPAKQRMTVILDPTMVENSSREMEATAQKLGLRALSGLDKQTALLQFYSQSAHAKLKAVGEYVKELLESDKKFLVFAHHQVMMDKLTEVCEKTKTKYIRIDGKTAGELRQNLVTRFQTNEDIKVAVLSIKAANTGITLTAAQLVLFAELFWNPGELIQAEDRAHRIGQDDSVLVQYLVARGTVDDYIWPMVQEKLNVLGKVGLSKEDFSEAKSTYQQFPQVYGRRYSSYNSS